MKLLLLFLIVAAAAWAELPRPAHQTDLPGAAERAPDGTAAVRVGEEPIPIAVPAPALGATGTVGVWFRLPREMRSGESSMSLIESDALKVVVRERESFVQLVLIVGPSMTTESRRPPRIQGLLTHLKAGRWYHAAFTWNGPEPSNRFILDGLDQGIPEPQAQPGLIVGATAAAELRLGSPGITIGAPTFWSEQLPADAIAAHLRDAGHPRYEDEGVNYTDEALTSDDITGKRLIYSTDFSDEKALDDWVREGGESASIVDGRLRLRTGPSAEEGQHIVFWLKRELPPDFLAEWRFRPHDKQHGLTIVFFNARGRNGESIFDPSLKPRDGTFVQYTKGDLDSYHISYYAGHRGSVNLRKNHGFFLGAIGLEHVHTAPPETFHTMTLYKRGGTVRLATDGKVSLKFDDDGRTYGPVHDHSGWFGLRQMYQAWYSEYDDLRVWAVEP